MLNAPVTPADHPALCISADPAVVELVSACAAAVEQPVQVVPTADQARSWWRAAPVVFVGVDCASELLRWGAPARPGVYLCADRAESAVPWSVPLGAAVLLLDGGGGSGQVTELLLGVAGAAEQARVVRLLGGSGGVGCSTLTAGLAVAARRSGSSTAAVELAADSGGLDLLFGAEREVGWRWPELARAQGRLGDVRRFLPVSREITLVSAGREPVRVRPGARAAVLDAVQRTHQVMLVDAGGGGDDPSASRAGTLTLLLVGADVHALMSARQRLRMLDPVDPLIVVRRRGRGGGIGASQVEQALGAPVVGTIADDRAVPAALGLADQPGRRRTRFGRQCTALWRELAQRAGWATASRSS